MALQARAIIEAQLAPAPPLLSAIPADTRLRDVFVTERGDAFVDLSSEVNAQHSGGALDELLTIYTIVDALTVNLPAITRVQILVDGKEVDTLAGHVDLRHPLAKSLAMGQHMTRTDGRAAGRAAANHSYAGLPRACARARCSSKSAARA